MGEFADYAIDELLDADEEQQRLLDVPFNQLTDGEREFLYDDYGGRYPLVFNGPLQRKMIVPKVSTDAPKPAKKKTGGGVWDRVVSVKEYASGQGMKIGIFGRSGTGKSTAVLSFPRKTLYIVPSTTGEVKAFKKEENVDVVGIEQANELLELINDTAQMKKYATVSLDHCTEFQGLVMKQVLNIEEVPEQLSWGLATMEQWQEIAGVLKEYLT